MCIPGTGCDITKVKTHKHLGMTFSDDMKWGAHIDAILKKAFGRLNGIRRLRNVIGRTVKETLYKSLVLPLVEYGSVLFDNCSAALKLRLDRLHRHAVTGAFKNTSFARLLSELGWNSLHSWSYSYRKFNTGWRHYMIYHRFYIGFTCKKKNILDFGLFGSKNFAH